MTFFINSDTSYPAKKNQSARLVSLPYKFSVRNCFSFWYHMDGRDANTLSLLLQKADGSEYVLWTRRFSQGNQWLQASVDLEYSPDYKLVLEGFRGASYMGDIALDDLEFREGACPRQRQYTFECDFDRDECGFQDDITSKLKFTRASGRIRAGTGPDNDHTVSTKP